MGQGIHLVGQAHGGSILAAARDEGICSAVSCIFNDQFFNFFSRVARIDKVSSVAGWWADPLDEFELCVGKSGSEVARLGWRCRCSLPDAAMVSFDR